MLWTESAFKVCLISYLPAGSIILRCHVMISFEHSPVIFCFKKIILITLHLSIVLQKSAVKMKKTTPFTFKRVPLVFGTLAHLLKVFGECVKVGELTIPDWPHRAETRAQWGPDHLLQNSFFLFLLKIALCLASLSCWRTNQWPQIPSTSKRCAGQCT